MKAQSQNKTTSDFFVTDVSKTKSTAVEIPQISLPKGGGALKGIDEKFQVNAANGTASLNISLPITPGRNGFSPALSLSYNSGAGNGIFGLGWSLDIPFIQRRTDKQLPRYRDTKEEEDVFMFSGIEDLVLHINQDSESIADYLVKKYRPRIEGGFSRIEKIDQKDHGTYWRVTTRKNITTIFGRSNEARIADPKDLTHIFQWLPELSYDDKGNWIQYHYKKDSNFDENGIFIEDDTIPNPIYEKNRKSGLAPYTNTYLKRITYGNVNAYYVKDDEAYNPPKPADKSCFFELILDYGEHSNDQDPHIETRKWDCREDAFSFFRAGFEVRTYRLCQRILMFHHFEGEEQIHGYQSDGTLMKSPFGKNYLVRSLVVGYEPSSINNSLQAEVTYLKSIIQKGFIRLPDGSYSESELPPMDFFYEQLNWDKKIRTVSPGNIVNAPVGLTNNYQWVDLYGEGISGILTEQGDGWYYKSNLGDVDEDGQVSFTIAKPVIPRPSFLGLNNGVLSIQDLGANGEKQVVVNSPGMLGFFELTEDNDWKPFKAFESVANIDWQDPNNRLIDLNGDGQPELVITEENVFVWYPADGKRGHLPAEYTLKPFDEEQGPAIIFADSTQSIFLADMTGDSLTDIVRIRNGETCYWANLGYGKFAAKVTMENSPLFDYQDQFNPRYLHLADISGTGATDILYLGKNQFQAFINLGGNAWAKPEKHPIDPFFPIDSNSQLSVIDLLGTGTSCIVWSSDLPDHANFPLRYIDLMNSRKPHVLKKYVNNFGKETSFEYKSSTYFYLKDKLQSKPWITKLHFPISVVSKTIVEDKISDVRFTTEYRYHHGYYDHQEREFRGFGMVEQLDTEEYETWTKNNATTKLEKSEDLYQAPTLTKTWFHTGAFLYGQKILSQYKKEYWHEAYKETFSEELSGYNEPVLPEARIVSAQNLAFDINDLGADEYREALRACKGMILRQEIFALDGKMKVQDTIKRQAKPYSVTTHNCHIQLLQPRGSNPHAVFMVTESEALTLHYERNQKDPRIAHQLNIKLDELGNVLESASVVYPRKASISLNPFPGLVQEAYEFPEERQAYLDSLDRLKTEQGRILIIYTQSSFTTNEKLNVECYHLRLPAEVKTFEITELPKLPNDQPLYLVEEFEDIFNNPKGEFTYHQFPDLNNEAPYYRLIEHIQHTYYDDDLKAELSLGNQGRYGIPYQSYQLTYTPELLDQIFEDKLPANSTQLNNLLSDNDQNTDGDNKYSQCRFVHRNDSNWWIRSGHINFYFNHTESLDKIKERFFTPQSYTDPFGAESKVFYYKTYALMMKATEDALNNRVETELFNFRTLSPIRMRDINDNLSEVLVNELGLVKTMAVMGKGNEADHLHGITEYTLQAERENIQNYFTHSETQSLRTLAKNLLLGASARFVYDFHRYQTSVELLKEQLELDPNILECERFKYLPTVVGSITCERHFKDQPDSPLQLSFEYSGGMGQVAMAKVQAEPGEAMKLTIDADCSFTLEKVDTGDQLRWLGNGRTVLNNKGNPVKQYEPYFSVTPFYEDNKELVERGVTPVMYYDAVGRLTKTELPDGTFTQVEFDSWQQKTFDANDTVNDSDWYKDRIKNSINNELEAEGKNPAKEHTAAKKASLHNNTPSILHLDTLGRPVLSLEHNRWDEKDDLGNVTTWEGLFSTWASLDIEGNVRSVTDARGNPVMEYRHDMLGNQVYQNSMDAGKRWMLNDVTGKPIRSWDSKNNIFSTLYDMLQRPLEMRLQKDGNNRQFLYEKIIYGEDQHNDRGNNLRGQTFEHYDSSGKITNIAFDYKGNLLEAQRQLAAAFDAEVVDWSEGSPTNRLEAETFTSVTEYDALNRPTRHYNWHRYNNRLAVYEPQYNERGVLKGEDHVTAVQRTLSGYSGGTRVTAIAQIEYNEKGQRTRLRYGNGTTTRYHYDRQNFRLIQLRTTRPGSNGKLPSKPSGLNDGYVLQNLYYTYDPKGNIIEIEDDAYVPVFFDGQMAEPRSQYTYDALYRLIEAGGRENHTFNNAPTHKESTPLEVTFPVSHQTLRNYIQKYKYDAVGNILRMRHISNTERWTRNYEYSSTNNWLLKTWLGNDLFNTINYDYDEHGNMLNYSKSPTANRFQWDYRDMPYTLNLEGGGKANYQYAGSRERSRKRIVRNGGKIEERFYLGWMEVYRRWQGATLEEEIETHHLFANDQRILIVEDVLQTKNPNLNSGFLYRYQYSNHLGSVSLEADATANIISYEEYHPYGTVAYHAKNKDIKATAKRYRYTGMERDEETGLNYHSARYYLPWLGRWGSCDPIGIGDGLNVYEYSNSNAIMFKDNSGKTGLEGITENTVSITYIGRQRPNVEFGRVGSYSTAGKGIWSDFIVIDGQIHAKGSQAVSLVEHPTASGGLRMSFPNYSKNSSPTFVWTKAAADFKTPGDNILINQFKTGQITLEQFRARSRNNFLMSAFEAQSQLATHTTPEQAVRAIVQQDIYIDSLQPSSGAATTPKTIPAPVTEPATALVPEPINVSKTSASVAKPAPAPKLPSLPKKGAQLVKGAAKGLEGAAFVAGLAIEGKDEGSSAEAILIAAAGAAALKLGSRALSTPAGLVVASAAVGAGVGYIAEEELKVSDYSSAIGMKVDSSGGVLGATVTALASPGSLTISIIDKASGGGFARLLGLKK